MADLTQTDVDEMKRFLADACAAVKRWLPEPKWPVGWQSETAAEYANQERGPDGPGGPDPVASVYTAAALYVEAVLQCARAIAAYVTVDSSQYVPSCLNRAAMEAGSQAFWLLEPGIGARRRVARFMLLRASGARWQAEQIKTTNPGNVGGPFGETPEQVEQLTAHYGLACKFRPYERRHGGQWWCEDDKLPGYTERNKVLEEAMFTPGAYSIQSSAIHGEWHSVIGNWEEVVLEDGAKAMLSRADRVAVWSTVLLAPAPAVTVATRAFPLLGYNARRREVVDWVDRTLRLMKQMDLPREWWTT